MGKVWLGTNDLDWVRTCVDTAVSTSVSGEFFRHRRNGYKALHVILRSNPNGKFLEVSEFHSGSRQGVLRIPEGETKKGWSDFSNLCQGFRDHKPQRVQAANDNQRQAEFRDVETRMGMEGILPNIPHADHNPVTTAVNTVIRDFQNIATGVNENITLDIKLELTRGQDGLWTIFKAAVENKAQTKEPVMGPKQTQQQPKKQMRPTTVWKPKVAPIKPPNGASQDTGVGGPSLSRGQQTRVEKSGTKPINGASQGTGVDGSSSSTGQMTRDVEQSSTLISAVESEAQGVETSITPLPRVEILAPPSFDGVDRIWGSSSAWMLELRDGRRVSIPISLLRTLATIDTEEKPSEEEAPSLGGSDIESEAEATRHGDMLTVWGDDEGVDDEVSVVWEDPPPAAGEGKMICWEDENNPLEVAPLAIAGPPEGEMITGDVCTQEFEQVSGFKPSPSEWVQDTMKEFGVVLGASYEGYKEQLMSMLQEIENRRNPQGVEKKLGVKPGGKGSRELRNLISNINYDVGSAKKRGNTRDKGLVCYPCS
jgi:hypothetical protein